MLKLVSFLVSTAQFNCRESILFQVDGLSVDPLVHSSMKLDLDREFGI